MKKGILLSLIMVLLLTLALALPITGAAKANKITVCSMQIDDREEGGKVWFSDDGKIMHIRGLTKYAHIVELPGHPECDTRYTIGTLVARTNIDLNLVTGKGQAWGKSTITLDGLDATWQGTFSGEIDGDSFIAKAVSHGTGELKEYLLKNTIVETGPGVYEVHGVVITH